MDKLEESFSEEMFQKKKIKIKNYNRFKRDFIRLLFANYYNSVVKIDTYKNNFDVPEFWIGEDISIHRCNFGKVSFSELKKRLGLSKEEIVKRKITRADISERKKKESRSSILNSRGKI